MNFSEKLLNLRKSRGLTQEQLAEKLEVSRQSVSKWESGQAVPELETIVALGAVFDVTTDFLLKSSEIDELSVKTELLERQQQKMLVREQKQKKTLRCGLIAAAVYLIYLAVYAIGRHYFELWNPSVILAGFLLATAAVIFLCIRECRS